MQVEIITVGSELLLGEILNRNSLFLSEQLNALGYSVLYHTTVGDNIERLQAVLKQALLRADIVITTGGLGPTQGDITKIVAADVVQVPLVFHEEVYDDIKQWLTRRYAKPVITENQKRQAMIPEGAIIFSNEVGTAPGIAIQRENKWIIQLPGPPRELQWMFFQRVVAFLQEQFGNQGYIVSRYIKIYDLGEALIESKLIDLEKDHANPTVAMYARPGFVEVRLTAKGGTQEEAKALLQPLQQEVEKRLGRVVVSYDQENIADALGRIVKEKQLSISAAESCTGGLIGSFITDVPGSSDYFKGTVCTYTNQAKMKLLGVRKETLEAYTAVSSNVANEMAKGSLRIYDSDIAISTTGIAGPGGATETQPVGLVYTGVTGPWGTWIKKDVYMGDRCEIKVRAATKAIYYAVAYILKHTV